MSPERPEPDDFLEDEEQEEYGQRSIFATGWFRAVLVLLVLAVIAVIAVPLIGGWFEPTPPPKVTTTPATPPPTTVPATPPRTEPPATPPPTAQAPSTPATPPYMGTPQPSPAPPAATPTPAPPALPPAATAPAPAKPETPAVAPRSAEKAKAPDRTAAVTPGKSAAKATGSGGYWVQVGAFKDSRNAEGLAKTLRSEGFAVQVSTVTRDVPLHVVRVGGYPDRGKASAAREELQGKGHGGFVTQGPAK